MIKHLDGNGISIKRVGLKDSPCKKTIETKKIKSDNEKSKSINKNKIDDTKKIIEYLQKQTISQKTKRPKKLLTLKNYLFAHFSQKIPMDKIKIAIEFMKSNKNIVIQNNKINYANI